MKKLLISVVMAAVMTVGGPGNVRLAQASPAGIFYGGCFGWDYVGGDIYELHLEGEYIDENGQDYAGNIDFYVNSKIALNPNGRLRACLDHVPELCRAMHAIYGINMDVLHIGAGQSTFGRARCP